MIFTRIELFWWMVCANLAARCIYELVCLYLAAIHVVSTSENESNKPAGRPPSIEP